MKITLAEARELSIKQLKEHEARWIEYLRREMAEIMKEDED